MPISVDSLIEHISTEKPCGDDIGYDPNFIELEKMLVPKSKQERFGEEPAALEPEWNRIEARCLELLKRSKDLRVIVALTLALLKREGLPGFRDGLLVLTGILKQDWKLVYPRLEDNNPTQRVNIVSAITTPQGTMGDPYQFLFRLRQAPLCEAPRLGSFSLAAIGKPGAPIAEVQQVFRAMPPERLEAVYDAILGSQAAVRDIDQLLTKAVGEDHATSFDLLNSTLDELRNVVMPHAAPLDSPPSDEAGKQDRPETAKTASGKGPAISGTIQSREDVIQMLDQICDFYDKTERSSPVPLILKRARRLVNKSFIELLTDLAPDSLPQINTITGRQPEAAHEEGPRG